MGFFQSNDPPPILPRPRCVRVDVTIRCDLRREAEQAGEMLYDRLAYRWRYPIDPLALRPKVPAFAWTFCPFCGGALPDPATLKKPATGPSEPSPYKDGGEGSE